MTDTTRRGSFPGAADVVTHAEAARHYLEEVCAACANGDNAAARRALRQAKSELELVRAMLRTGLE